MGDRNKTSVLVAEDDFLVSEEISRLLKRIGYEVIGACANGTEAVEMACSLHPDIVLMDIQMPEIDGLEATRRIQEKCPTPVVVLTAHESQDFVAEASEAGVSAYLTKPPNSLEMERAITIAQARHGDLMELRRLNRDLQNTSDRLAAKSLELQARNAELQGALNEIRTLRGILPFCSWCKKKLRNDEGHWEQIDTYIRNHTEAEVSHSICPDCVKEHYPELG